MTNRAEIDQYACGKKVCKLRTFKIYSLIQVIISFFKLLQKIFTLLSTSLNYQLRTGYTGPLRTIFLESMGITVSELMI